MAAVDFSTLASAEARFAFACSGWAEKMEGSICSITSPSFAGELKSTKMLF